MKVESLLTDLREKRPLVLCITNFVTANDCANALLAVGAAPVMALSPDDAADLAESADAVLLNMGTPTGDQLKTMLEAGRAANRKRIPLVLDPVGAGASSMRRKFAEKLLDDLHFSVIRGNAAEMGFLGKTEFSGRGVDAGTSLREEVRIDGLRKVSSQYDCIAGSSGAVDLIYGAEKLARIQNGHPLLTRITGTGCMSGALIAAMLAVEPGNPFDAALMAALTMGIAGELAAAAMRSDEGNTSFRCRLIDVLSQMTDNTLVEYARYELA